MFLVDVPPEEAKMVQELLDESKVKLLREAPIILMRITDVKGQSVSDLVSPNLSENEQIPGWILRREFRSTFRSGLTDTEKVIAGEWSGENHTITSGVVWRRGLLMILKSALATNLLLVSKVLENR